MAGTGESRSPPWEKGMGFVELLIYALIAAAISVIVGELSISLAYRINRSHISRLNQEVLEYQRLSEEAARLADPETYRAVNREGNEAFGRLFFYKIALSCASLWPIFFALEWLQSRYGSREVLVPHLSWRANYAVVFLACYVLCRVLFGRFKGKLPYFRDVKRLLNEDQKRPQA